MKVVSVFAHVFSIFAFLTMGSLLFLVAFRFLPVDEAVLRVKEIYADSWKGVQFGCMGATFVAVGLVFARILIKKGKETDVLIYQTESGPILVSSIAIEDIAKKIIRRFSLVRDSKVKVIIHGKKVELRVRLMLWTGGHVQQLLTDIQKEIYQRVAKIIGTECALEVVCDVIGIEEHAENIGSYENKKVSA